MKIFLTGGTGFIGKQFIRQTTKEGNYILTHFNNETVNESDDYMLIEIDDFNMLKYKNTANKMANDYYNLFLYIDLIKLFYIIYFYVYYFLYI